MSSGAAIVLLSGPIAVGKSSVSSSLVTAFGFSVLKSSAYLKDLAASKQLDPTRRTLQDLGDGLDIETDFAWVVNSVAIPQIGRSPNQTKWLFDSVRKEKQVTHFRSRFAPHVLHVHLHADEETLKNRYAERSRGELTLEQALHAYDASVQHQNEISARRLVTIADMVLDALMLSADVMAQRISTALGGDSV